ncbi:MAG TPA: hypothetical protein ENI85_01825, partial [Deltaproteobacteria bacterium]|nr:hypothetical protein [Deltaproteobacteria bacterium]
MHRIRPLPFFLPLGVAAAILSWHGGAFAQSRTVATLASYASVDASGNATPACGGNGNALTTTLNNILGTPGFDDEVATIENRRTVYRLCDFLSPTGANGWTTDNFPTLEVRNAVDSFLAPDETFAAMDNANAAFDLQTAN